MVSISRQTRWPEYGRPASPVKARLRRPLPRLTALTGLAVRPFVGHQGFDGKLRLMPGTKPKLQCHRSILHKKPDIPPSADVAMQGSELYLLRDWIALVGGLIAIKIRQHRLAQSTHRGELRRMDVGWTRSFRLVETSSQITKKVVGSLRLMRSILPPGALPDRFQITRDTVMMKRTNAADALLYVCVRTLQPSPVPAPALERSRPLLCTAGPTPGTSLRLRRCGFCFWPAPGRSSSASDRTRPAWCRNRHSLWPIPFSDHPSWHAQ